MKNRMFPGLSHLIYIHGSSYRTAVINGEGLDLSLKYVVLNL